MTMADDEDIRPDDAKRLSVARLKRGFADAKSAAAFFGWNYSTYSQHERGERGFRLVVDRYAKAYRVSAGWLLTGEGEGPDRAPVSPPEGSQAQSEPANVNSDDAISGFEKPEIDEFDNLVELADEYARTLGVHIDVVLEAIEELLTIRERSPDVFRPGHSEKALKSLISIVVKRNAY